MLLPHDGGLPSGGNGTHIAFAAQNASAVDRFYKIALKMGGTDEGSPGDRAAYQMDGVYTAYIRDPFGNKLEVIHNGFSAQS